MVKKGDKDRLGVNVKTNDRRSSYLKPGGRRRSNAPAEDDEDMEDVDMAPIEVRKKPSDQVQLTDEQLGETFTKYIGGSDPNVCPNTVLFKHADGQFEHETLTSAHHLKVHFRMDGELIDVSCDEARAQADKREAKGGEEIIKNQFLFSERGTQAVVNPMRAKEICTEPPPTGNFNEQVSQWTIFDTYLESFEAKIMVAAEAENKKKQKKHGDDDEEKPMLEEVVETNVFASKKLGRALKIMERMIHTNSEAEDFTYFKYYEDKNEAKREDGRGSFMPLWRFEYEPAGRKSVTAMCWNPEFTDLYAVGFGSYDFLKQTGGGMICCYTLKNTSHPEFVYEAESGVMTLDFNKDHSSLLCVGMYDGTVAVFDLNSKSKEPIFQSTSPETKHTDPVWQVYWGKEGINKGINFYSVSTDGKVANWELSKTELNREEVCSLKLYQEMNPDLDLEDENETILGLAGGSCFDFNPADQDLFIVGTEEGAIQSYSKAFNTEFLRSFQGHHMAIYAVKWNTFHPKVFLSCSADWTVKLWECGTSKPVMTFDLNTVVGDVAWSPFSSTVFATITTDGKVRVYDLDVNKHEPIGEWPSSAQRTSRKAKLTKICFNPNEPIICVGDDRGIVQTLKLSNNLRKMSAPTIGEINVEDEIAKLDRVMIMPDENENDNIAALLEAANKGNTGVGKPAVESTL